MACQYFYRPNQSETFFKLYIILYFRPNRSKIYFKKPLPVSILFFSPLFLFHFSSSSHLRPIRKFTPSTLSMVQLFLLSSSSLSCSRQNYGGTLTNLLLQQPPSPQDLDCSGHHHLHLVQLQISHSKVSFIFFGNFSMS